MKNITNLLNSITLRLNLVYQLGGIAVFLLLWQLTVSIASLNNDNFVFEAISPAQAIPVFGNLLQEADFWQHIFASLYRIGSALALSLLIGVPVGLVYANYNPIRQSFYLPFQFLRMISPLSWMPLAVLLYDSWDGAIIFLIVMATIWPIIFNISQGISKVNPGWLQVTRSFNANTFQKLFYVVFPAIAQDLLTGLRLALGVSWVVIVPAEFLGVTSGLGYAINDARDTLDYSRLMALILSIGFLGLLIDSLLQKLSNTYKWNQ